MSIKIVIDVSQEKDGSMSIKYKGETLKEIDGDPRTYADVLYGYISAYEFGGNNSSMGKALRKDIEKLLVRLLVHYGLDV